MKVRLFPSDQTACGFYRMIEPGRVVQGDDCEVEMCFTSDEEGGLEVKLAGRLGAEKVVAVEHPGVDVVVLQRPAHKHLIESIPFLQAHGVAVVCDYDDDFDSVDMRNPAFRAYDPGISPMSNKVWAKLASELADLVTVATPALAKKYGKHGRVQVLPNCVPESYLKAEPFWPEEATLDCQAPRIGWAGNPSSHPGDLEVMGKSITNLIDRGQAIFRTLGSKKTISILEQPVYSPGVLQLKSEVAEWAPIEEFPNYVASFDVGVVPLRDSTFNKAKSWLKGLEYAALGVPFVASPTKPYVELSRLGAGDVVRTTTANTGAWQEALTRLVEDEDYRWLRSVDGRQAARHWTYEGNSKLWLQAWSDALSVRRAK